MQVKEVKFQRQICIIVLLFLMHIKELTTKDVIKINL